MAKKNNCNFNITLKGVSVHHESFTADEIIISGNLDSNLVKQLTKLTEMGASVAPRNKATEMCTDIVYVGQCNIDWIGIVKDPDLDFGPYTSHLMVAGYGPARHNLRRLFDKSADEVITWCDVICIKQIDEHHAVISFRMGVNDKPVIVYGRLLKALIEGANGGKITREVIERAIF